MATERLRVNILVFALGAGYALLCYYLHLCSHLRCYYVSALSQIRANANVTVVRIVVVERTVVIHITHVVRIRSVRTNSTHPMRSIIINVYIVAYRIYATRQRYVEHSLKYYSNNFLRCQSLFARSYEPLLYNMQTPCNTPKLLFA